MTEVNKDRRNVEYENSIWKATSLWEQNVRVNVAQNTSQPKQQTDHQVGGTATIAFNDFLFRISDQGVDERKLVRWNILTITGKNNLQISNFTCYCPCTGMSPGTAYSQHLVYMARNKDTIRDTNYPRQLF